jgi:hypothetical protein
VGGRLRRVEEAAPNRHSAKDERVASNARIRA